MTCQLFQINNKNSLQQLNRKFIEKITWLKNARNVLDRMIIIKMIIPNSENKDLEKSGRFTVNFLSMFFV